MNNIIQIKRRSVGGANGAPAALSGGELAFNENDKVLYYGYDGGTVNGDNNPGTIIGIAGPGLFVDRTTDQTVGGIKTFTATVSALGDVEVDGTVDANEFSINGTTIVDSSENATFANIDASGNLTVQGDFTVYGNSTTIETLVTAASAFTIESASNTPALTVKQYGPTDVAVFYDGDTANTAFIIKDGGNVGINTSAPNKTLTVVGDISATGTLDITNSVNLNSTLTVTDDTTLNGKLYVDDAVSFNSSLSAKGSVEIDSTLTVDGTTTLNDDLTVIDYAVVKTSNWIAGSQGNGIEIDPVNNRINVDNGSSSYNTLYTANSIDSQVSPTGFTISTVADGGAGIKFTPAVGSHTNVTQGNLNVQVGNLVGNTLNKIEDFIIDGGSF